VGIAAILPHLRLLIQQYLDIADYVGSPSINRGIAEALIVCTHFIYFLLFFFNLPMCTPWRDSVYAATPLKNNKEKDNKI
jgi:hypothetical protein